MSGGSQQPVTPAPGDPAPSSSLCGHPHTCDNTGKHPSAVVGVYSANSFLAGSNVPGLEWDRMDGADKWGPLNLQSRGLNTFRNTIWVCVSRRLSVLLTFGVFQKPTVCYKTFWTSVRAASVLATEPSLQADLINVNLLLNLIYVYECFSCMFPYCVCA